MQRMAVAMTEHRRVAVLGASSLVGQCLLPLLVQAGWQVDAYSRRSVTDTAGVVWRQLPPAANAEPTPNWLCVAPIWVLPEYFAHLEATGVQRVVALSSTSRFTKVDSADEAEASVAARLVEAEKRVAEWAQSRGIEWLILRPTLIYGFGRDKNITEIARFIRRFHFFPILGKAAGLRQPIHAEDVAQACLAALAPTAPVNRAYDICGAETLTYRELVKRVFVALDRKPRLVAVPLWAFHLAVAVVRCLPRYRHWSATMAERMNCDLVFDCGDARRELGFAARPFQPSREDLAPSAGRPLKISAKGSTKEPAKEAEKESMKERAL